MIKRILIVITMLLISTQVYADDASHRQACEDLMKMMNVDKMTAPMYAHIKKIQNEMMVKMNIPDDMADISKKHSEKFSELMKKEMSWSNMKDDYINMYIEIFSESEIKEIIIFYNSSIGKKLIDKSPVLMQKSMEISQKRVMKLLPEMEELSIEMKEEIEQRGLKK